MKQNKVNRVKFNDNVSVHETIHLADFTEKEIINTWYMNEETVHNLERTLRISKNECSRGLEDVRSSKRRNHQQKQIKKAVLNVLKEQERQKDFGCNDAEKIALVNVKDNGVAISKALELGLMDYEYIEEKVISECNDNEKQILAKMKQMSAGHSGIRLPITGVPSSTINREKRPECLDSENTLKITDCSQYELELKSNTMDLTRWSVALSVVQ